MIRFITAGCGALLACGLVIADPGWPEFRGPHGQGVSDAKSLPLKWGETESVSWHTPIHGRAWSSPVIEGERIWLSSATPDGKELFGICVDLKSGKIIQEVKLFE